MYEFRDRTLGFESKLRELFNELRTIIGDDSLGNQVNRFNKLARQACPLKLRLQLVQPKTAKAFFEQLNDLLMRRDEDWFEDDFQNARPVQLAPR